MALLAIGAAIVAPSMSSFFRGRVLNSEARRLLSLVHYSQSRAVAEGVPVVLWLDSRNAEYGLLVPAELADQASPSPRYTLDQGLTLEIPSAEPAPASELGDESLGLPDALPSIRFLPDGFLDEISVPRIIIRQGREGALELALTADRLSYEILPAKPS